MYKARLALCKKTQVELMAAIREHFHESLEPAEFSKIVNGVLKTPKAERVIKEIEIILKGWER